MGEYSSFKIPGKKFLEDGRKNPLVKEDSKLILEIELAKIIDYEKPKWELNSEERLEYSGKQKELGNGQFKKKEFQASVEIYEDGYQSIRDDTGEEYERIKETLLLNSAMALIKLK